MRAIIGVIALLVQFGLLVECAALIYLLRRAELEAKERGERRLELAEEQVDGVLEQQALAIVLEQETRRVRQAVET